MQRPPEYDLGSLAKGDTRELKGLGTIVEFVPPDKRQGPFVALGKFDGQYPLEGKGWARNTKVDEWYVVREGSVGVKFEDGESRLLEPGNFIFIPKGIWYAASFSEAVVEISTYPAWTPEQHESK